MKRMAGSVLVLLAVALCMAPAAQAWEPVAGKMLTEWGAALTPETAWQEYPRPQMVRERWTNLNGLWQYAVTEHGAAQPSSWAGDILVPFAPEAPLSGVGRLTEPTEDLWYTRTFSVPARAKGRLLLHFEAVDYQATVWVNGKEAGAHTGGNLPFALDISNLVEPGQNTLVVRAHDETDAQGSFQMRGKQVLDNKGIWYTRVSGIWQTVWLEQVPERYIEELNIKTKVDGTVTVEAVLAGTPVTGEQVSVTARLEGKKAATATAPGTVKLAVSEPQLWSPDSPALYDLEVALLDNAGRIVDQVNSYTGIREVGKVKDAGGNWRTTLNNKIIFHWGTLDQGWWPDGLLTPPSDAAMASDVEYLKAAGFNMIRKHIKVEPRRYYYHLDKMGVMLWQDQPSGGLNPPWERLDAKKNKEREGREPGSVALDAEWPDAAHTQYMAELKGMVDHLDSHPCIVMWVPFNERWGQHRSMEVGQWIVQYDPARLVNIASGGNFFPVGDVADEHNYPDPAWPLDDPRYDGYVKVMGEFGGHGFPVTGHLWSNQARNWGYGGLPENETEYVERYKKSMKILGELKEAGVSAGVYTQTTDVEGEINGLLTYDRKVQKMPAAKLLKFHEEAGLLK